MTPSDFPRGPPTVMSSRRKLVFGDHRPKPRREGSLRFLDWSFNARRPLPPRRARPLQMLVASRSVSGFTLFGRLATLKSVTRPNRVHLRYG